jgi:hypothetical protein
MRAATHEHGISRLGTQAWVLCVCMACGLTMAVSAALLACSPSTSHSEHTPIEDSPPLSSDHAPSFAEVGPNPDVLRMQGDHAFRNRDWEAARRLYAAALDAAHGDPVGRASVHVALAKLAERRGSNDEATEHLRRAQALHPSAFAEQWLANGRNCDASISAGLSQATWSETWPGLVNRLATEADIQLRAKPRSEAAARRLLCDDACDGVGPWIVGLSTPDSEYIEHLAVVMPRPDAKLEVLADGWYSNAEWECNHKNRIHTERILDTTKLIHVRVETSQGAGEWHSCPAEGYEGCVEYCREVAVTTYDWFLEPDTHETLAVVARSKKAGPWDGREDVDLIPDASEVGGDIDLEVEGRSLELIGCGRRTRVQL